MISEENSLEGCLLNNNSLEGNLLNGNNELYGELSYTLIGGQPYLESYEVVSLPFTSQTLDTADKVMLQNMKIKEIPYHEVSNQYGTTVSISS